MNFEVRKVLTISPVIRVVPMLFDKYKKPVLSGLDAESDFEAIEAFEDFVYNLGSKDESCPDDQWDYLMGAIREAYADYYRLHEA